MNILFYIDPAIDLDSSDHGMSSEIIEGHFYNFIYKALEQNSKVKAKTIISELAYYQNETSQKISMLNLVPIMDEELRKCFEPYTSREEICKKIYHNELNSQQETYFIELIKNKLGDFVPDIIISFPIKTDLLSKTYPQALVLTAENAIFSRPPFVRTLYYDPIGSIKDNFLIRFKNELANFDITPEQDKQIEKLKHDIINQVKIDSSLLDKINYYKTKYKHLVLLPLSNYSDFHKGINFKNDYDYLSYVMEKIPDDIGLIVTQHDGVKGLLKNGVLNFFQAKYPNLIFIENVNNLLYGSSSLYFFDHVDAIINGLTATGILSLFWDKKIISSSKNYNDWFKDTDTLDNIKEFLARPKKNKNNIIYWYLTHYCIFEKRFLQTDWLYNYFEIKLEKYRKNGITFDYFEEIEDINQLSEYIVDNMKLYYHQHPVKNSPHLLNSNDEVDIENLYELREVNETNNKYEALYLNYKNFLEKNGVKIFETENQACNYDSQPKLSLYSHEFYIILNQVSSYNSLNLMLNKQAEMINELTDKLNIHGEIIEKTNNSLGKQAEIIDELNNKLDNQTRLVYDLSEKLNKPTFLQQIFSVRNENSHKVFRIFGAKIKFKKRK